MDGLCTLFVFSVGLSLKFTRQFFGHEAMSTEEMPPPPPEEEMPPPPDADDMPPPPPLSDMALCLLECQLVIGQLVVAECAPISGTPILQVVAKMQSEPLPAKAVVSMALLFHEHDSRDEKEDDDDLELELCTVATPQVASFLADNGGVAKETYAFPELNRLIETKLGKYSSLPSLKKLLNTAQSVLGSKIQLSQNLGASKMSSAGAAARSSIHSAEFRKFVDA